MRFDPFGCPLCQQGKLSQIILMDVWSCSNCHHLFEWDVHSQQVQILDFSHPLVWWWNGKSWQREQSVNPSLTIGVIVAGLILVIFPSILIAVASYIFPPLPDSSFAWFPIFWAGLAFVVHSCCLGWVMIEAYQFQPYLWLKIRLQRFSRFS